MRTIGFGWEGLAREQSQEPLGSAVDDVNLVERDGVRDGFPFLQLTCTSQIVITRMTGLKGEKKKTRRTLRALDESGLGSSSIVIPGAGEGSAKLANLACCLVDRDDVSCLRLIFGMTHSLFSWTRKQDALDQEECIPFLWWGIQSFCCPNRTQFPCPSSWGLISQP